MSAHWTVWQKRYVWHYHNQPMTLFCLPKFKKKPNDPAFQVTDTIRDDGVSRHPGYGCFWRERQWGPGLCGVYLAGTAKKHNNNNNNNTTAIVMWITYRSKMDILHWPKCLINIVWAFLIIAGRLFQSLGATWLTALPPAVRYLEVASCNRPASLECSSHGL